MDRSFLHKWPFTKTNCDVRSELNILLKVEAFNISIQCSINALVICLWNVPCIFVLWCFEWTIQFHWFLSVGLFSIYYRISMFSWSVDQFCQYIKSNLGFNSFDIDVEKVIGETRAIFGNSGTFYNIPKTTIFFRTIL